MDARDAIEQCGFPRAVRSDEARDGPVPNVEGDAVDGDETAEMFHYIVDLKQRCRVVVVTLGV